jgi:hypothetical protein
MTREKLKEMVKTILRSHDPRFDSASDTAEKIMKIWDQGFAYEIPEKIDFSTDDS